MKNRVGIVMLIFMMILVSGCGKAVSDPQAWQEQYDLGVRYLSNGDYEEARIAFEQAIKIDPKKTEAYIGMSDVYMGLGNQDQAIAILEEALAIDEMGEEIYVKLSDIYASLENYEAAMAIMQQGIEKTNSEELQKMLDGASVDVEAEEEENPEEYDAVTLVGKTVEEIKQIYGDNYEVSSEAWDGSKYFVYENGSYLFFYGFTDHAPKDSDSVNSIMVGKNGLITKGVRVGMTVEEVRKILGEDLELEFNETTKEYYIRYLSEDDKFADLYVKDGITTGAFVKATLY